MSQRNLMPIGRFARSCRLGVKALRHYDELGLLEPAFVDPQSRYRYYSREQARDAVMISMLRSLDLPLAAIREALNAEPAELKNVIDRETARIEAEVSSRQNALLSLQHIAQSGDLAAYEIAIREEPERQVARISGTTTAERLIPETTELVYALLTELDSLAVEFREPIMTINEFDEDGDRVEVQACAGVVGEVYKLGRAELAWLSGGAFAWLTHEGPYETLGLAHHALFAWVQEHGHEPMGPVWEFYVNDPAEVSARELITEVLLPLAG